MNKEGHLRELLGRVRNSRLTKRNDIVRWVCACEGGGLIVQSIAISQWAFPLEVLRVKRRLTFLRWIGATENWRVECLTGTHASHWLVPAYLKLPWTRFIQVDHATNADATLATLGMLRHNYHWEIVTIDHTYVIEVLTVKSVEGKLDQSRWRRWWGSRALYISGTAVSRDAGEPPSWVGGAERSTPETTSPWGRHVDDTSLSFSKKKASGREGRPVSRIAIGSRPDTIVAFVFYGYVPRSYFCDLRKQIYKLKATIKFIRPEKKKTFPRK